MNESKFVKMITESRHCGKVFKCIEECAEMIQAINKKRRGRAHNLSEEIADVEILCPPSKNRHKKASKNEMNRSILLIY